MTRLFILLPLFLHTVAFSQCSLEISDTTHVNCNGENTGAFSFNVTAAEPYSVSLSNGAVSMNGTSFANLNACAISIRATVPEPSSSAPLFISPFSETPK